MAYAALSDLKALLDTPDTIDDTVLSACLSRAQATIDRYVLTIRSSFVSFEPVTNTTRYYGSDDGYGFVEVHDLVSVTTLASDTGLDGTYATTIVGTDYWLLENPPYYAIRLTGRGVTTAFVSGDRTIKITGTWGFPAVPDDIKYATLATAVRMFKNKAAGFGDVIGVQGDGGVAYSRAMSAEVKMILDGYARWVFA